MAKDTIELEKYPAMSCTGTPVTALEILARQ
jgi:hypothetical protein